MINVRISRILSSCRCIESAAALVGPRIPPLRLNDRMIGGSAAGLTHGQTERAQRRALRRGHVAADGREKPSTRCSQTIFGPAALYGCAGLSASSTLRGWQHPQPRSRQRFAARIELHIHLQETALARAVTRCARAKRPDQVRNRPDHQHCQQASRSNRGVEDGLQGFSDLP